MNSINIIIDTEHNKREEAIEIFPYFIILFVSPFMYATRKWG